MDPSRYLRDGHRLAGPVINMMNPQNQRPHFRAPVHLGESGILEEQHLSESLPVVYLARHGETAWSLSGQHTGFTDLPLTDRGERNARRLGERLKGLSFAKVFTSPLQRASRTCELAGFGAMAQIDPDLVEWDYGRYEGLTSAEILRENPDWACFRTAAR